MHIYMYTQDTYIVSVWVLLAHDIWTTCSHFKSVGLDGDNGEKYVETSRKN